ncbi:helix-turn-helix domain-containing protein [Kitasatospora indigofera]|uniref:helix-turn-helix domain-containing protein n=1 Tax=Kitasatospora indigofera TaxID=67307 RepID=UPI003252F078
MRIDSVEAGALAALQLLAAESPPSAFDDLLHEARRQGLSPDSVEKLTQVKYLTLRIHGLLGRQGQREAELSALVDTARDLSSPFELDALLKVISRRARLLLNLDMAYISFHDSDSEDSYIRAADGHATALTVGFRVPGQAGLGGDVRSGGAPFWTADYLADDRIRHVGPIDEVVRAEGLRAILAVPLRYGDSPFGVLYVADRGIRHFTPAEVALMTSLADLAAVAIERTQLTGQALAEIISLEQYSSRAKSELGALRRAHDSHSRMVDLLLDGGDLQALTTMAAEALGGAVAVRDGSSRILAFSGEIPGVDESAAVGAALDSYASREPVCLPDGTWVAAVTAHNQDFGHLLARPERPLGESGVRLLALTAKSVALLVLMHRTTAATESLMRDEFFDDLLAEPQRPVAQLRERARRLGLDLSSPHVVVVARLEGGPSGRAVVWASSYALRMSGLKSIRSGCIALLLPGVDASAAARAVSGELSPILGHQVTAGAAGPVSGIEEIAPIYHEAQRCLSALTALGSDGGSASLSELGFIGVLLGDSHSATNFIDNTIGPVLDYDTRRLSTLVRTLEAYFAAGSSPTYAAEALHVHPNTVSRRLERITELLGPDWQKPAQALEIQLALRLQRTRDALQPSAD